MHLRTFLAASLAAAVVAVGCSWGTYDGSYTGGPSSGGGGGSGSSTIDSAGGTVTSVDGIFTLDVPAGAVMGPVTLTVTPIQTPSGTTNTMGPSYTVTPTMKFAKSVGALFHETALNISQTAYSVTLNHQPLHVGGVMNDPRGTVIFGITDEVGDFSVTESPSIASYAACSGCDPTCASVQCHSAIPNCNDTDPAYAGCYATCRQKAGIPDVDSCGTCAKNACLRLANNGHTVSGDAKNCLCETSQRGDGLIQALEACGPNAGATGCTSDIPVDGAPPAPGLVSCSTMTCNLNQGQSCCGGQGAPRMCGNGSMGPCNTPSVCDEEADCMGPASSCCGSVLGGDAKCVARFSCLEVQYCRTNSECPSSVCKVTKSRSCILETCDGKMPNGWPPPECQ